ncbi:hypothetical protein HDV06_000204 [Boothiomyces sp. JEL0866]|nr:hypothetical protein HDV06_000204 [Boothiomyces sp. JEL0866]
MSKPDEVYRAPPVKSQLMDNQDEGYIPPRSITRRKPDTTDIYIGPPVKTRLHSFDIALSFIYILISIWLLSGISFILSVTISALVNTAYTAYSTDGQVSEFIELVGLTYILFLLLKISISFVRTFLRLISWTWDRSREETFVSRFIQHIARKIAIVIYNKFKHKMNTIFPSTSKKQHINKLSDKNHYNCEMKILVEEYTLKISQVLLFVLLTLLFGVPLYIISLLYGYWVTVSYLTMGMVLFSSSMIILTNFTKRLLKSYFSLSTIYNTRIMLETYVAFAGYGGEKNLYDIWSGRCIWIGVWTLVTAYLFSGSSGFYIFAGIIIVIGLITKIPIIQFNVETYDFVRHLPPIKYYPDDSNPWESLFVLATRLFFNTFGVGALFYYDCHYKSDLITTIDASPSNISILIIFLIIYWIRDLLFFIPIEDCSNIWNCGLRKWMVVLLTILDLLVSIIAKIKFHGYSSSVMILLGYLNLDYRQPHYIWNDKPSKLLSTPDMEKAKLMNSVGVIVKFAISTAFIAIVLSVIGNSSTSISSLLVNWNPTTNTNTTFYAPVICGMNIGGLDIKDYAFLAHSAYYNQSLYPAGWSGYPHLTNWTVGAKKYDTELYDVYNSPGNFTVVSVRGTDSVSDGLQDVYLYSSSVLLALSSYFGTFLQLWPIESIALVVNQISQIGKSGSYLSYWQMVGDQVQDLLDNGKTVVITGHSLGGAISGIVSAKYGIKGIAFSSPGLGYQSVNYDFRM